MASLVAFGAVFAYKACGLFFMTYSEKLKDPRWQRKRLEIFQRDGFTCQKCQSTNNTLHVHHLKYSKGEPWDVGDSFLMTLCEDCHTMEHPKFKEAIMDLTLMLVFECKFNSAEDIHKIQRFFVEHIKKSRNDIESLDSYLKNKRVNKNGFDSIF